MTLPIAAPQAPAGPKRKEQTTGTALAGLHDDHIAESRSTMRSLHRLLLDGDIDVVCLLYTSPSPRDTR